RILQGTRPDSCALGQGGIDLMLRSCPPMMVTIRAHEPRRHGRSALSISLAGNRSTIGAHGLAVCHRCPRAKKRGDRWLAALLLLLDLRDMPDLFARCDFALSSVFALVWPRGYQSPCALSGRLPSLSGALRGPGGRAAAASESRAGVAGAVAGVSSCWSPCGWRVDLD